MMENLAVQATEVKPVNQGNQVQMASLATTVNALPVQKVRLAIPAFLAKMVNPEMTAFPEQQAKTAHPVVWEVLEHRVLQASAAKLVSLASAVSTVVTGKTDTMDLEACLDKLARPESMPLMAKRDVKVILVNLAKSALKGHVGTKVLPEQMVRMARKVLVAMKAVTDQEAPLVPLATVAKMA